MATRLAGIMLTLCALGDGQLLGDGGHHSLESDVCTMANFDARTQEVDGICCDQANSLADVCLNGVPQACDPACAGVYLPWFEECQALIATIVEEHLPIYTDVFEMCQAGDPATLFTLIHDVTIDGECEISLPHTPISRGCFDVGCRIDDTSDVRQIDGVNSPQECQELCNEEELCMYFVYRTDGGSGAGPTGVSGPNCLLKPATSEAHIVTDVDGWPAICGPKTCKEVAEERFHWDGSSGMQGWSIVGDGVTGHSVDAASHLYGAGDCIANCEEDSADSGWGNGRTWGIIPTPWENRDIAQSLLIVRSPGFANPVRISFDLMGGSGNVPTPIQQPTSDTSIPQGYMGVCLRRTLDGVFLRCYSMDCGSAADGWTSGTVRCDNRAADSGWTATGTMNWQHIEWDVGEFVTDTVTQYTLELIDNYGGGPWGHVEMQDVSITASLVDQTPNQFYSASLPALVPMVTVQHASGGTCTATGTTCTVSGTGIRPSLTPPPFGLQGYTFGSGDALMLTSASNDDGVDIDGTWTVDCFIRTPFDCTNCDNPDAGAWTGWHTLVRGKVEDHPALLWNQDESTLGAYDNSDRGFVPTTFKMSSLADGWHRLTITGNEGFTEYFVDGVQVGSVFFTATESIYWVGNTGASASQQWGDLAGFMLFDEAMTPGQVAALYHGACVAATNGLALECMEQAELSSGLGIGDQVEHRWESTVPALCHAPAAAHADGVCDGFCHSSSGPAPDPMIARGTVCGFDGSMVLVRWDLVSNQGPSNLDHPNCGGCSTHPDDLSCTGGHPYWTRLQNGDAAGAPRDSEWLADWMGDPGTSASGPRTHTCGVPPTESELPGSVASFELSKISCTAYPLGCVEQAAEVINTGGKGGHRRTQDNDSKEPTPDDERGRQLQTGDPMGIHVRPPKGLDSGDTQTCDMSSLGAMAENVNAECCYQSGVYECATESNVPESCSYTCGAALVPFVDACHDLLEVSFATQLDSLTALYDQCLNGDARVLQHAYETKDCCTASNCGGCKSLDSCSALSGQCNWGSGAAGRQVDTRCNCVLPGLTVQSSVLSQHNDAYPDFASCSAACSATVGCNFFAVFEETPGDDMYPDYCRMWTGCDTCERSVHYNTVWQVHEEYEKTPPMSWTEAEQYCVSNGGHLASIHSQGQHDLVWQLARGERIWIGLNDRQYDADLSGASGSCATHIGCQGQVGVESQFVWSDGTATDFTFWTAPQPDNAFEGIEHEDCGEMYSGYGGGWNDRICSSVGPGMCYYPRPPADECVPVPNAPGKYVRVDDPMSFDDAQAYCRAHFHDLASVHSAHENDAAVLACKSGGVSALTGDWVDPAADFYGGSIIHITEDANGENPTWSVDGNTYVGDDILTATRIGNGYLLNEHDTASNHDYGHMVTLEAGDTAEVFTRPGGNAGDDRIWHLRRVSSPPVTSGSCRVGFSNTGPGHTWEWSDGTAADFQYWTGAQGAIADNAGRVADGGYRMDDATGHFWDGPAGSLSSSLCERFE
jgi:hypothetical protein